LGESVFTEISGQECTKDRCRNERQDRGVRPTVGKVRNKPEHVTIQSAESTSSPSLLLAQGTGLHRLMSASASARQRSPQFQSLRRPPTRRPEERLVLAWGPESAFCRPHSSRHIIQVGDVDRDGDEVSHLEGRLFRNLFWRGDGAIFSHAADRSGLKAD
jgi:hypothetical protein